MQAPGGIHGHGVGVACTRCQRAGIHPQSRGPQRRDHRALEPGTEVTVRRARHFGEDRLGRVDAEVGLE